MQDIINNLRRLRRHFSYHIIWQSSPAFCRKHEVPQDVVERIKGFRKFAGWEVI